jgi:hypothetical protein
MTGIKTKVTCPKCKDSFDYEFVPGASLTSVRLGNYRYMKCRKCGKWALFNMIENLPREYKKILGLSSILFGSLLTVLSILLIIQGDLKNLPYPEIVGVIIAAVSMLMIISGAVSVFSAKKV